ncbi:MAG: phosphatase PAP2 family protein [Lachnospiraceae bacterium]|nr:phosphatase PAP2 family protein [Lachnospiraceae bacterium]
MRKRRLSRVLALTLACSMLFAPAGAVAHAEEDSVIAPHEAAYGYFADTYRNNADSNTTPETNPTIGILAGFSDLWKTGSDWHNGTKLNASVLDYNIKKSYEIALSRTAEEAQKAYEVEKGLAQRIAFEGIGEYKDQFIELSGIGTNDTQWSPRKGEKYPLFATAHIVRFMRSATNVSTSPSKRYFAYPRPYRWNVNTGEVIISGYEASVLPEIDPVGHQPFLDDASVSGCGFPSGHTNAIFLTSYGLAYGFPWKFHEIMMNAAEGGNYRIVAGVHSCLDVMGGRMTATALSASIFADKENGNFSVMPAAYEAAYETLFKDVVPEVATLADYEEYQKNLDLFTYYLTYDFEQIGDTTQAMRVPKGAESVLETRLPYLTDEQRRYVIYTTGLESGYPLLDDAEGWGRVNYYKAAAGYGAFVTDVVVNMDASKGAFNASDNWLNDISGDGSLTLQGTGRLGLAGNNTFTGGVNVAGGELVMISANGLGAGNVNVNGGILSETVDGIAMITGDFAQTKGTLKLTVDSDDDIFNIAGNATLGGKLVVEVAEGTKLADGMVVLSAKNLNGSFAEVEVIGADGYTAEVKDNAVMLLKGGATQPTKAPAPTDAPAETPAVQNGNNTVLYVVLAVVAVAAIAVVVLKKRK